MTSRRLFLKGAGASLVGLSAGKALALTPYQVAVLTSTKPFWLPTPAPLLYADFANGYYYFNGLIYSTFTAWMTAIGGVFSRASSAAYFDSTGVLQTATSNVARFAYNPISLAALGLRLTGARTNLALSSKDLSNITYWDATSGLVVTANNATAPDGTVTANRLVDASGSILASHASMAVASGSSYVVSWYVKKSNIQWLRIGASTDSGRSSNGLAWFDLTNGVTGSTAVNGSGVAVSGLQIQALPNGWYRVSAIFAISGGATTLFVFVNSTIADASSTRVVGGTYWAWQADVQLGLFIGDPIATTSASATEAADSDITGPTGGIPLTGFSATAGTLFVRSNLDNSTADALAQIDDNSANNVISLHNGAFLVTSGGVTQANITRSADTNDDRLAAAWSTNDFSFAVNGSSVGTDVSGSIPTVDRIRLMATTAANSFGNMKQLGYWPSRLSDADLARIAA